MTSDPSKASDSKTEPCPVCGDTDGLWCSLPNCPNEKPDNTPFGGDFDHCMRRIEWHFTSLVDENSYEGARILSDYYSAKLKLLGVKIFAESEFRSRVKGRVKGDQK